MPSPIIARADALMHRRRQSDSEQDDIPVLTDSIDPFEDIPVLTDIEPLPENAPPPDTIIEISEPVVEESADVVPDDTLGEDQTERERLIDELAGRIEARIKVVLPEIISSTIREFLAEQEMIENS